MSIKINNNEIEAMITEVEAKISELELLYTAHLQNIILPETTDAGISGTYVNSATKLSLSLASYCNNILAYYKVHNEMLRKITYEIRGKEANAKKQIQESGGLTSDKKRLFY
ncbi:MAG: hypothetical protein ACK5LZ_06640 [Anaerorhabdus sp.]